MLVNSSKKNYIALEAIRALRELGEEAKRNGTSETTLEEINREIYLSRRESEAREARMRLAGV